MKYIENNNRVGNERLSTNKFLSITYKFELYDLLTGNWFKMLND